MNRATHRPQAPVRAEPSALWRDPLWLDEFDTEDCEDEAEVARMIELNGMVGVDCALLDLAGD